MIYPKCGRCLKCENFIDLKDAVVNRYRNDEKVISIAMDMGITETYVSYIANRLGLRRRKVRRDRVKVREVG